MLTAIEEMKIVSILEYIKKLDKNNSEDFSNLQQISYDYMRYSSNEKTIDSTFEKFIDVYSCNYYNDYFIECLYLFQMDDEKFKYKKERVTLSELMNIQRQKNNQLWLKPSLQGKMQDILQPLNININSKLRSKSILLYSCMEGYDIFLDKEQELKFLEDRRDKVLYEAIKFDCYIQMTFTWKTNFKLNTDILNNIKEIYIEDKVNEDSQNFTLKSLKEIKDKLTQEYEILKKAEV